MPYEKERVLVLTISQRHIELILSLNLGSIGHSTCMACRRLRLLIGTISHPIRIHNVFLHPNLDRLAVIITASPDRSWSSLFIYLSPNKDMEFVDHILLPNQLFSFLGERKTDESLQCLVVSGSNRSQDRSTDVEAMACCATGNYFMLPGLCRFFHIWKQALSYATKEDSRLITRDWSFDQH